MEKNRSKKINLDAFYIYKLDEKQNKLNKNTFLVILCCNKSRIFYHFPTLSSTGLTSQHVFRIRILRVYYEILQSLFIFCLSPFSRLPPTSALTAQV